MQMSNVDEQEIKKFSDIANEWWNKDGDFKPLHIINPLRANYIKEKIELTVNDISNFLGVHLRYCHFSTTSFFLRLSHFTLYNAFA